jgi:hypothetical protein
MMVMVIVVLVMSLRCVELVFKCGMTFVRGARRLFSTRVPPISPISMLTRFT